MPVHPTTHQPNVVYHADWGSKEEKRWCARANLGADGCSTAYAPKLVGNLGSLIGQLRVVAGETGCALAGFDFPIGVPEFYAKRAGITSFRTLLSKLGHGGWGDFYSVCDEPDQISVYGGATMILPGETETGSAGTQLCRGITWRVRATRRAAENPRHPC